jgi:hypothetical protein
MILKRNKSDVKYWLLSISLMKLIIDILNMDIYLE